MQKKDSLCLLDKRYK